jgi:hypothetical protein
MPIITITQNVEAMRSIRVRSQKEDIPLLVAHFVEISARKAARPKLPLTTASVQRPLEMVAGLPDTFALIPQPAEVQNLRPCPLVRSFTSPSDRSVSVTSPPTTRTVYTKSIARWLPMKFNLCACFDVQIVLVPIAPTRV